MREITVLIHHPSWMGDTFPPLPPRHRILRDPSLAREADVVLFHLPTLRSIGINKYSGQLWVGWCLESEENYPILKVLKAKGRGYFDLWMTYQKDSEIWCPYFEFDLDQRLSRAPRIPGKIPRIAYFASNEDDPWGRTAYVRELMAHTRVDSFGRSLNNMPPLADRGRDTKLQTIARYKFTLALENSFSRDYVTEKFFDPLLAGSVPVYRGAPNIDEFAPGENCYIDAGRFESPRELAEYLNLISRDEKRYAEFQEWRHRPFRENFLRQLDRIRLHVFDRLSLYHESAFGDASNRSLIRCFH